ncbi:MAG: NlpC/P60 family protein [Endomicrobia bacterium]|nr:NlpC/P60 family protein [Endomicrobiia bacterium]MCL2800098.1 NlpC/P60 family protein [Endomicrobiia bacterium]
MVTFYPAPLSFDDVPREMKSAGYWISKIDNPDLVILDKKGIEALNARITGKSFFLKDIRYFPQKYAGSAQLAKIKKDIENYSKYYDGSSEQPVGLEYLSGIIDNIDYSVFGTPVDVKFAMTVKYAQLRALPSDKPLYSSLETSDIDRIQFTLLDLGSPLAVLYASKDYKWFYVVSEVAEGWIRRDSIAFCGQNQIKEYKKWKNMAVFISASADIYKDKEMKDFFESVKMGTQLPFYKIYGDYAEIRIPVADKYGKLEFKKGFVAKSDISVGFLKYTQRNALIQAFKNLDHPYGWGGMNGDQDCSAFLKQVFACFGIMLPRNSTGQIQTGVFLAGFESSEFEVLRTVKIIKYGIPGITLLYFPGHIMLYIGNENNKPYIIHSVRGYAEDYDDYSKVFIINKVAVTSMNIGEASKKGSFLKRTVLMKAIQ